MGFSVSDSRVQLLGSSCHVVVDDLTGQGERMLSIALQELQRIEAKFCAYQPGSVISDLNRASGTGGYTPLDAETRSLLQYATAL